MHGLGNLPYEVLANIAENLPFHDIFSLGLTSKDFLILLIEERICKSFVQNKIKHSTEARTAVKKGGGNARALRIVAKRREAIASARPFVIATVGFCDAYVYRKGILCYTLDDRVRVLDLHRSAQEEFVISIPVLLTEALSDISDKYSGKFKCLYYANGILSCLYDSSNEDSPACLIAFHIKSKRILMTHELESTDKIFVRHNSQHLYYGTHSEIGTDGYKKWVIHGYEYKTRKWYDHKVRLPDMVGSEIDSTICFEIYKEHFYALSNQTSFEVEEIDWTSFYHCVRFPLNSPCKALEERTENESMWRRQHQEGPIDDRWTSLRLDEDETTGELKIIEARKEWYKGCSKSQRTYYTTDIIFPVLVKDDEELRFLPDAILHDPNFVAPTTSSWVPAASFDEPVSAEASSSSVAKSRTVSGSSAHIAASTLGSSSVLDPQDTSDFPDEPLRKLIRKDDNPHHMHAPGRNPERTHPSNDGSTQPTHTLAKSRVRGYQKSCSTFLDLVDDPHPDDWQGTQRLRLRAGTRKLRPPLLDESGLIRGSDPDLSIALGEMYKVPPISYWPKGQDLLRPNEHDDEIHSLMNPPTHLGNVEGTMDERSLVYLTGDCNQPRALIFVGFDPSINLAGLKQWGGVEQWDGLTKKEKGVGEGPHIDGRATGCNFGPASREWHEREEDGDEVMVGDDVDELHRTVSIDVKGKRKAVIGRIEPIGYINDGYASVNIVEGDAIHAGNYEHSGWVWREKAMYRDIGLGLYLGRDKKKSSDQVV